MGSDGTPGLQHSRNAGDKSESDVIQVIDGIGSVPERTNDHVDAVVTRPITMGDARLSGKIQLRPGQYIEIKSAMAVYSDGRSGRFYFREPQHKYLETRDAVYALVVCRPTPGREPIAIRFFTAAEVGAVIDGKWTERSGDRYNYSQRAWTNFFSDEEVER